VKATRIAATVVALTLGATCVIGSTPALAHHSFAMFDMTRTSTIDGTVRSFEWSNPHSWLFVEAAGPDGVVATYGFEMASVGELLRRGWTKTAVRPGDKIKVAFHPFRDGSPAGQYTNAWTSDGKLIGRVMGPPGGGAPGGGAPDGGGSAPAPAAPASAPAGSGK
jgi:Family of unknown function (DUF6152)